MQLTGWPIRRLLGSALVVRKQRQSAFSASLVDARSIRETKRLAFRRPAHREAPGCAAVRGTAIGTPGGLSACDGAMKQLT